MKNLRGYLLPNVSYEFLELATVIVTLICLLESEDARKICNFEWKHDQTESCSKELLDFVVSSSFIDSYAYYRTSLLLFINSLSIDSRDIQRIECNNVVKTR